MGRVSAAVGAQVYLDTNIVIYAVEGFVDLADQLQALLQALDNMEIVAFTSELTLAEVLVKPMQDQNQQAQRAYETFLTPSPALQVVPISRSILTEAARLRATTKLKLPDAIHLATADLSGCSSFLTNDDSFKSVASAKIKILSEISLV
ncbi:MAG: type II toxin-antitoxin system VapC family toxin [Pyrinomonadaceae bacterium]